MSVERVVDVRPAPPRGLHQVEWPLPDALLRLSEPSRDEVRAAAASLAAHYNDPVNRALMTHDDDHSADDVVALYERMWAAGDRPFFLYANGEHVGDADFRHVEADRAEFAIMVGPRGSQAKGLGTRFSVMALALAFGPLGLRRVYASVRPENTGSLRMFEKVGYVIDTSEGARRYADADDDVCLSIGAEELRGRHAQAITEVSIEERMR